MSNKNRFNHRIPVLLLGLLAFAPVPALADFAICIEANASDGDFPNSLVVNVNGESESEGLVAAWYDGATERYKHGVLGDQVEAGELHVITNRNGEQCGQRIVLGADEVFEDTAPRMADMDGDGEMDVVAVVSHVNLGARLAVYGHEEGSDMLTLKSDTPNIGKTHRWLAPIGTGDFNDDGLMDVAFVDRPHMTQVLRVYSYDPKNGLTLTASAEGFTNHRIGENFISSGVRTCGGQTQLLTVDPTWSRVRATTLKEAELITEEVGVFDSYESIELAMECNS